ncbi:MAG: hypothetical protein WBW08_07585 [Methyloceanibacter sp.]
MANSRKFLARAIAAAAIAAFWCLSFVGTAVGVTTLSAAVTAASSTAAEAYYRGYRRYRGYRGYRHRGRYRRRW